MNSTQIDIDLWELLTINRQEKFVRVDDNQLIDSNGKFKKPIINFKDLKLIPSIANPISGTFGNIFFYNSKDTEYVLKWEKEITEEYLDSTEYFINFTLNNLAKIIQNKKNDLYVKFTPDTQVIFFSDNNHFMVSKYYNIVDDLIKKSIDDDYLFMICKNIVFSISCKLCFLQEKFKFVHNDLKINNMVYRKSGEKLDFLFIDFGFSRMEINSIIYNKKKNIGIGDNKEFIESKDMYILIHNLLIFLKLYKKKTTYQKFLEYIKNTLNLDVDEYLLSFSKIKDLTINIKNFYFDRYKDKVNDSQNLSSFKIFYISYDLKQYDPNFSPENIYRQFIKDSSFTSNENFRISNLYYNLKILFNITATEYSSDKDNESKGIFPDDESSIGTFSVDSIPARNLDFPDDSSISSLGSTRKYLIKYD